MTIAGIFIMAFSWVLIIGLCVFTYYKIFKAE